MAGEGRRGLFDLRGHRRAELSPEPPNRRSRLRYGSAGGLLFGELSPEPDQPLVDFVDAGWGVEMVIQDKNVLF